ncbi:ComEC/Rec2 family competence protein [Robiginitalea aurantiaca]|uniref:ComEC/Rec2 family competence protein n=1 Tax=Robiginitalea aurantiaca TaxID=3056915 RepID=A0ABT7WF14_9FLAO|nr:ComEC/Rec2 family competence protein [Robiginitalea aurantiaca]MDM9631518.1 ComEC/Rec2 family competence protein [Robiginitalea aurantiaca]
MSTHTAASLYLAGMLAAGVVTAVELRPGLILSSVLAAASLLLLFLTLRGVLRKGFWILSGLSCMGIGLLSMAIALPENQPDHYLNHVRPEVKALQVRILETLKPGRFAQRYTAEAQFVDNSKTKGKILLEIQADSLATALSPGQQIHTPVLPGDLAQPLNPGAFDYAAYLKSQGIHSRLRLTEDAFFHSGTDLSSGVSPLTAFRSKLLLALRNMGLGSNEVRIAQALLLGERSEISPHLHTAYKKAGVLHLLAISGLHVGILAAFLFTFLAPLKRLPYGKMIQVFLGLSILWAYALIAGFSPSVVRAVVLYSFVALALYLQRPGQTLHFLGLSWMFMLVVINPNWLFQVGFQLSFAAVASIVVFFPVLFSYWPFKKRPWNYPGKLLAVSLAAQLGTLPFTLYYFHQFPGLFLLSNLVLLPGIGAVLVTGLICLTLEVFHVLPSLLPTVLDHFLWAMNHYTQWASAKEVFFIEGITFTTGEFILCGLAVLLLGIYLRAGLKRALTGVAILLLLYQVTGISLEVLKYRNQTWVIPHQVGHTMIWKREGPHLKVFSEDSLAGAYAIRDAQRHWNLDTTSFFSLRNGYSLDGLRLRVLDSSGLYSPEEPRADLLLLSGSPRVHFGRVLDALKPALVIADGSNYTSDLARWERSCKQTGIPFHATAKDGAFMLKRQQKQIQGRQPPEQNLPKY